MNLLKTIKWAPLDIPLNRRLQTLSILVMLLLFVIGTPVCLYVLYKTLYSAYWWVAILYLIWMIYDVEVCHRGGRISEWVRNLPAWRHYCDYFPLKLVKTAELDPSKNYILCCFPHGLASFGAFGAFGTNALDFYKTFPGMSVNMITLRERFIMPIMRELFLAWGGCSSTVESLQYLLNPKKQGKCAALVIGGSAEVLDMQPGQYNLRLKKRKGFARVALLTGASLVPVFSFGENDLFRNCNYPEGTLMRRWHKWFLRVTGLIPVIPTGRGIFQYSWGLLPFRNPVTVVVGAPISVERKHEPTQEEVDALHATFIDKLQELFENEKAKYIPDHENVKLRIY